MTDSMKCLVTGIPMQFCTCSAIHCEHCGDTRLTTIYNYDGNGSDADEQECPHCAWDVEEKGVKS